MHSTSELDRYGPTACNADGWATVHSGLYQLPQNRDNAISRKLRSCVRLWKLENIFIFTNLKKNLMYAILICVFSKNVNVCNFRDMWEKNNFYWSIIFLICHLYRNVYQGICILIEEFDGCLYVSRSMITPLNYAWFYSWFHFDLYIFLWLWYLMFTWLYNELLFLNVFFSFFFSGTLRQQASSSMWGDYVQNLLREGIQKPK